ncbi:hypothetical protein [Thiomicrorhabdus sp.]|uniref:hypothetical protein n=1 Tax=Thiomicrorhabdus sp. TaxID=2039724 RepID=UPI0029C6139A|nr:hypothetical protein [Thiomicrorhabdus sp.]
MKDSSVKHVLSVFTIFVVSMVVTVIMHTYDGKYFTDSIKLASVQGGEIFFTDGYTSSATLFKPLFEFFKFVGVSFPDFTSDLASLYFVSLFFLMMFWSLITLIHFKYSYGVQVKQYLLLFVVALILSPFMAVITKEIIYVCLIFPALYFYNSLSNKTFIFIIFGVTVLYSLLGRSYYFLYAFLLVFVFFYRKKPIRIFVLSIALIIVVGPKIYPYFEVTLQYTKSGEFLQHTNTWIKDIFNNSTYDGFVLNVLLNTLRIFFPIELFLMGVKYWVPAIFMIYVNFYALKVFLSLRKVVDVYSEKYIFMVFFSSVAVLTFNVAQGLFEPDYGSVLRHKLNILFFIIILFSYERKRFENFVRGRLA